MVALPSSKVSDAVSTTAAAVQGSTTGPTAGSRTTGDAISSTPSLHGSTSTLRLSSSLFGWSLALIQHFSSSHAAPDIHPGEAAEAAQQQHQQLQLSNYSYSSSSNASAFREGGVDAPQQSEKGGESAKALRESSSSLLSVPGIVKRAAVSRTGDEASLRERGHESGASALGNSQSSELTARTLTAGNDNMVASRAPRGAIRDTVVPNKINHYTKCLCTVLSIHVHIDRNSAVLAHFPETMGIIVDSVTRYGGSFDIVVPEMMYASFGSRRRMKDHALRATECAIEIYSRLSPAALKYCTFVVDTGVYFIGICGVRAMKSVVLWGRPMGELLYNQQLLSGWRVLVTDTTAPLIRQKFQVLPVDVVTIAEEQGKPNVVLYGLLTGSVSDPSWEPFSKLYHQFFFSVLYHNYADAVAVYDRILRGPYVPFTSIFYYFYSQERLLIESKDTISVAELRRQLDELSVSCMNDLCQESTNIVMLFGSAISAFQPNESASEGDCPNGSGQWRSSPTVYSDTSKSNTGTSESLQLRSSATRSSMSNPASSNDPPVMRTGDCSSTTVGNNLSSSLTAEGPDMLPIRTDQDVISVKLPNGTFKGIALGVTDIYGSVWQLSGKPIDGAEVEPSYDSSLSFLGLCFNGAMAEVMVYSISTVKTGVEQSPWGAIKGASLDCQVQIESKSMVSHLSTTATTSTGTTTLTAVAASECNTDVDAGDTAAANGGALSIDMHCMHDVTRLYCHGNIVQLISMATTATHVYAIAEWVPGGTLQDAVHRFGRHLALAAVKKYCVSLLRGLEYLHTTRGVPHGLMHPGNILVGVEGSCKLTGMLYLYEWARPDPKLYRRVTRNLAAYCSPEMNLGEGPSAASDIYTFGLLLLQMLTGSAPWTFAGTSDLSAGSEMELYKILCDNDLFKETMEAGALELRQYGLERNIYFLSREQQQQQHTSGSGSREEASHLTSTPVSGETAPADSYTEISEQGVNDPLPFPVTAAADGTAVPPSDRRMTPADPSMLRVLEGCLLSDPSLRKTAAELLEMLSEMQ